MRAGEHLATPVGDVRRNQAPRRTFVVSLRHTISGQIKHELYPVPGLGPVAGRPLTGSNGCLHTVEVHGVGLAGNQVTFSSKGHLGTAWMQATTSAELFSLSLLFSRVSVSVAEQGAPLKVRWAPKFRVWCFR